MVNVRGASVKGTVWLFGAATLLHPGAPNSDWWLAGT